MERLQKIISNYGWTSRRKAEELIIQGKVKVNGQIAKLGMKASPLDKIEIDGKLLKKDRLVYYLLNKPRGVVSTTSDEKNRKTVLDLIETNYRVYPVGRLDYNTTGLILLTNDGELTNLITHPKNKIKKTYIAKIKGDFKIKDLKQLEQGVYIDDIKTRRAKVKIKSKNKKSSIIELAIHEGRNHQVKKMFKALGYDVLKLKREKIAFLDLTGLKSGKYRSLTKEEVSKLFAVAKKR